MSLFRVQAPSAQVHGGEEDRHAAAARRATTGTGCAHTDHPRRVPAMTSYAYPASAQIEVPERAAADPGRPASRVLCREMLSVPARVSSILHSLYISGRSVSLSLSLTPPEGRRVRSSQVLLTVRAHGALIQDPRPSVAEGANFMNRYYQLTPRAGVGREIGFGPVRPCAVALLGVVAFRSDVPNAGIAHAHPSPDGRRSSSGRHDGLRSIDTARSRKGSFEAGVLT